MISHIFNAVGHKTAHFTTTNAFWGGQEHENKSGLTTETPLNLYGRVKAVKKAGDEYLVVESSAHAVVQHRLAFLHYIGSAFTNLSHDHLDYFGDMDTYARAKQGLFKLTAKNNGWGVFIGVDEYTKLMQEPLQPEHVLTFGLSNGDLQADALIEKDGTSNFVVTYNDEKVSVAMPLIGEHNVKNALAAIGCALQEGIEFKAAAQAMSTFSGVIGRMERYESPKGTRVLVDFAHTPEAFELVLSDLRKSTKGKLIAVFGGYGDRDKTIRAPFGQSAATYADHIILTEDDVASETVAAINEYIKQGIASVSTFKGTVEEIEAREEAILRAVQLAEKDDTIALLGKGHERFIKRYPEPKPWNEVEALKDAFTQVS
jgi:UDP-N-acetylmuramoyl-L-alanyl-D-glutamate--2,6-diaminopimelate ligase